MRLGTGFFPVILVAAIASPAAAEHPSLAQARVLYNAAKYAEAINAATLARSDPASADAAALVIATDPRFSGAIELTPDIIGASKWWKAEALPGGGYRIELTVGWGDCFAGCIERHVWTFDVDATGGVTLVSESGDPVPSAVRTSRRSRWRFRSFNQADKNA